MSEYHIQAEVVKWARRHKSEYPGLDLLHSSLNGASIRGGGKSWSIAKAAGALPGVPDMFLPVARGGWNGLYLETKQPGKQPSDEQREIGERLQAEGYLVVVFWSTDGGIQTLTDYLAGRLERQSEELKF